MLYLGVGGVAPGGLEGHRPLTRAADGKRELEGIGALVDVDRAALQRHGRIRARPDIAESLCDRRVRGHLEGDLIGPAARKSAYRIAVRRDRDGHVCAYAASPVGHVDHGHDQAEITAADGVAVVRNIRAEPRPSR